MTPSSLFVLRGVVGIAIGMLSKQILCQTSDSVPWRSTDQILLQLCFDKLNLDAPKRISTLTINESSVVTGSLELVARTNINKPIYQGSVGHPGKFKSVMYQVPGTNVLAKIDKPTDLQTRIDLWKHSKVSLCSPDSNAPISIVNGREISTTECPELGTSATIKVASMYENLLTLRDAGERGPSIYNGLNGCNEFVYPLSKAK